MPPFRIIPFALLACLAATVAPAQAPAPAPAAAPIFEPPTPAENQLDAATIKVRILERIAARLEQDVDMLNQKFKLEGNFYKDTGHRIRLQLNLVGMDDTGSTMLQVCDGKVLWDYQKVLGMQSYRKRDITPILDKLKDPVYDEYFRGMIMSNMGFGGPEAMLAGLRKAVKFDQVALDKVEGVDVFVLGGTWRDRSTLLGPNDRPLAPTAPLPPYIPSNVRVFVGQVDGWPYKIEMIGKAPLLMEDTRSIDPVSGRPIGQPRKPPKVDPTKITLRYKLLPPSEINDGLFVFAAPADSAASNVKDETEEFVAFLDNYIQVESNRKKAEAAKNEAEVLKAPTIEIRPDPEAPAAPK